MLISYKRNTITTTLSSFLYINHQYKYISPKRRYFFSDILSLVSQIFDLSLRLRMLLENRNHIVSHVVFVVHILTRLVSRMNSNMPKLTCLCYRISIYSIMLYFHQNTFTFISIFAWILYDAICLFIYLSIYLSVYLSIYLSI